MTKKIYLYRAGLIHTSFAPKTVINANVNLANMLASVFYHNIIRLRHIKQNHDKVLCCVDKWPSRSVITVNYCYRWRWYEFYFLYNYLFWKPIHNTRERSHHICEWCCSLLEFKSLLRKSMMMYIIAQQNM